MPVRSCPVPLTPLSTRVPSSEGPWSQNFRHLLLVIFLAFANPQRDTARRHLRRCQFAFISHSERPFQYKQHPNCSNLGSSHHTPLLLPKQGCGLSSTRIFLRCLHSCRNVNSDVQSIPIAEASPDGSPRGVIKSTSTRVNRVHQLIRLLSRIKFIHPKPDKHGLFQCVHTEQPRSPPREE